MNSGNTAQEVNNTAQEVNEVNKDHVGLILLSAVVVLFLDQISKWWALEVLADGQVIPVAWTLRFRLVFNNGSAFGSFQNMGPFLGILAVGLVVWLMMSRKRFKGVVAALAVGSIIGGALGNLSDRVFRAHAGLLDGAVVDFIDVQWWPVWNVADMGIVVGACAIVWSAWREQDCREQCEQV